MRATATGKLAKCGEHRNAGWVSYNQLLNVGGWELKFAPPRQAGQLPALIHALPTGNERQDMEVKIERPFHLKLDVIATDEHVPSMRADVSVHVQQFGHSLEYRGSLWFDCASWDTFVSDLSRIDETQAKLVDMGGSFVLALGTCSGKPEASWEVKKIAMDGSVATAACRFPADPDTLAHVKRQFTEFPRWW